MSHFKNKLEELKYNSKKYLRIARKRAKEYDLNPKLLEFSDNPDSKLMYDKTAYFGAPDYNDYIIYSLLEEDGKITQEYKNERRNAYLKRATKIKGNWKNNKLSANNLAINILW
ncbi:MAG: hypothetical protein NT139_01145 [Candidatus Woesearchaeota archaeon]|nr:hypothetical protein [Candidatus Woesearchaeota archaeon]